MIEKSYYMDLDFKCWYERLGSEAREEFKKWMDSFSPPRTYRSSSLNYDFGNSYCNNLFKAGEHLVYVYTDRNGIPFYVGKGDSSRAVSIYNRSDAFKERLSEAGSCRIFAVAFDIMDEYALEIETLLINELIGRGWRLTNRNKVCISQSELDELRRKYPEVLTALNSIQKNAIDYLLGDEDNEFGNTVEVKVRNKSRVG